MKFQASISAQIFAQTPRGIILALATRGIVGMAEKMEMVALEITNQVLVPLLVSITRLELGMKFFQDRVMKL